MSSKCGKSLASSARLASWTRKMPRRGLRSSVPPLFFHIKTTSVSRSLGKLLWLCLRYFGACTATCAHEALLLGPSRAPSASTSHGALPGENPKTQNEKQESGKMLLSILLAFGSRHEGGLLERYHMDTDRDNPARTRRPRLSSSSALSSLTYS